MGSADNEGILPSRKLAFFSKGEIEMQSDFINYTAPAILTINRKERPIRVTKGNFLVEIVNLAGSFRLLNSMAYGD
jgi:hypothetical protein